MAVAAALAGLFADALLATLLYCRDLEITDTLVELLISTVRLINARAEVRVTKELIKEFTRVAGEENLLFRVAEATVNAGDQVLRDTVFPVAPQAVLADLAAEFGLPGRSISARSRPPCAPRDPSGSSTGYARRVGSSSTPCTARCPPATGSRSATGAIKLTPLDAAAEPRDLRRLEQAVQARELKPLDGVVVVVVVQCCGHAGAGVADDHRGHRRPGPSEAGVRCRRTSASTSGSRSSVRLSTSRRSSSRSLLIPLSVPGGTVLYYRHNQRNPGE
jgi:hypothetical protein